MDEPNWTGSGTATGATQAGKDSSKPVGLMGKLRDGATAQLNTQKDRATDGLGSVAQAVRQSTQHLREQQHDTVARYVEQAADQIERFSQRLKDKNVGDLVNDAQDLARRQPALFVGSAFALGLLGARFFKSSERSADRAEPGSMYGRGNVDRWQTRAAGEDHRLPSAPGLGTGSSVAGKRLDSPGAERF